jgi:hypothetical protein
MSIKIQAQRVHKTGVQGTPRVQLGYIPLPHHHHTKEKEGTGTIDKAQEPHHKS